MANPLDLPIPSLATQQTAKSFCRMTIIFPVSDDVKAVTVKTRISEILADVPQAQLTFTLADVPTPLP